MPPESQGSKGAQTSKLLADNSLPSAQGHPISPCGKSCRHSRRVEWKDRRWKGWEGYLGGMQNFVVLACLDKIKEARTWLDLKLIRSMEMNFWDNTSSKRKTEEQVVRRAWWTCILVDIPHSTEQGLERNYLSFSHLATLFMPSRRLF